MSQELKVQFKRLPYDFIVALPIIAIVSILYVGFVSGVSYNASAQPMTAAQKRQLKKEIAESKKEDAEQAAKDAKDKADAAAKLQATQAAEAKRKEELMANNNGVMPTLSSASANPDLGTDTPANPADPSVEDIAYTRRELVQAGVPEAKLGDAQVKQVILGSNQQKMTPYNYVVAMAQARQ